MRRRRLLVSDLIELAAMPGGGATEHLTKVYDWQYSHLVSQARGFAGSGIAFLTVTILPVIQPSTDSPTSWAPTLITWAAAFILMIFGAVMFRRAAKVHREFVMAQTLLAALIELQPFIRTYRRAL